MVKEGVDRPNILFLVSDQHQARLMGCAGHEAVKTPHLDRLAARGVLCHRAYTSNPICTPSRVSMLSGQYPHNHGYFGLGGPTPKTLPNLFGHVRRQGYQTAGIGKLHLPDDPRNWVVDDLDLYAECYRSADGQPGDSPYYSYLEELGLRDEEDSRKIPDNNGGYNSFDARPSTMSKEHVVEYWCAREAIHFMDESYNTPWCMQVSFPRPHHQLTPQKEFWDMYKGVELPDYYHQSVDDRPEHFQKARETFRNYNWDLGENGDNAFKDGMNRVYRGTLACVTQVDDAIGRILDHLESNRQLENTIIVYTSDHGAYHGAYGLGEKFPGICSEEVCRIPMIWSYPSAFGKGRSSDAFINNVDIVPTLLSLSELDPMETVDGEDAGKSIAEGTAESGKPFAVTENEWSKAIRAERYRLVYYPRELFGDSETGELYDMEKDPWETINLYSNPAYTEVRNELTRKLLDWIVSTHRHITSHPPGGRRKNGKEFFKLAEDGKESNTAGPRQRLRNGQINYL